MPDPVFLESGSYDGDASCLLKAGGIPLLKQERKGCWVGRAKTHVQTFTLSTSSGRRHMFA